MLTLFKLKKPALLTLVTLSMSTAMSLTLTGCETGEDRQLAAGQACLDSATTAPQANSCITIVQGLTSPESYMIRCSANFVAQGFTGTRIADAITKIKNNTGGTDPMVGMMAYLIFNQTTPTASDAVTNCTAAGSKSMLRLATAAKLATSIATFAGGAAIDPTSPTAAADLKAKIDQLVSSPSPAANTELGNTAIIAAQAYCSAGSSYENTEVCTNLKTAVGTSSDPQAIGAALLTQLQANTGH